MEVTYERWSLTRGGRNRRFDCIIIVTKLVLYRYITYSVRGLTWISLVTTGSGMSTAKRKSMLVSFYKSIVGTIFPYQGSTTSSQGTVHEQFNYTNNLHKQNTWYLCCARVCCQALSTITCTNIAIQTKYMPFHIPCWNLTSSLFVHKVTKKELGLKAL